MNLAGVEYEGNTLEDDQFAFHPALEEVWLPRKPHLYRSPDTFGCTNLTSIDLSLV